MSIIDDIFYDCLEDKYTGPVEDDDLMGAVKPEPMECANCKFHNFVKLSDKSNYHYCNKVGVPFTSFDAGSNVHGWYCCLWEVKE